MFRLGDFYELFYEDAVTAARELEITLTSRNKEKGEPIPMCGVPYHAAEGYLSRLIQKGYRVAICDQMEEAGAGKKLVKREVTRVVTPGTATESSLLRSHENNYLAAVCRNGDARRSGPRRYLHRRIPRHGNGLGRSERRAGKPECARGAGRGISRRARRTCARASRIGSSAWITPTALCAIISGC